jgi:hypothetical protein
MTLAAAITQIQTHADACTGVKYAPAAPPETAGALPAVYAYPSSGNVVLLSYNSINSFDTITVDYVTPRTLLDVAQANCLTFIDEFPKKLALDPTLAGTVTTIQEVSYTVLDATWSNIEVRIVRFVVPTKIHGAAS